MDKKTRVLSLIISLVVTFAADTNPVATFQTTEGTFTAEIYLDRVPRTASNFIDLVQSGFYNGIHFHRVIADFMIQCGCPNARDPRSPSAGMGGPDDGPFSNLATGMIELRTNGGNIEDEHTSQDSNEPGTISMANNGFPNSGGSQFFINVVHNEYLDWFSEGSAKHPVFGKVLAGMDVVKHISTVETQDDNPVSPIKMMSISISFEEQESESIVEGEVDSEEVTDDEGEEPENEEHEEPDEEPDEEAEHEDEEHDDSEAAISTWELSLADLQAIHIMIDKDVDGNISMEEVKMFAFNVQKALAIEELPLQMQVVKEKEELLYTSEELADWFLDSDKHYIRFKAADLNADSILDENELLNYAYPHFHDDVLTADTEFEFKNLDEDGNGTLTLRELHNASDAHWTEEDLEYYQKDFTLLDKDGNGLISLQEFRAFHSGSHFDDLDFMHLFDLADRNNDTLISSTELEDVHESLLQDAVSKGYFQNWAWAKRQEL